MSPWQLPVAAALTCGGARLMTCGGVRLMTCGGARLMMCGGDSPACPRWVDASRRGPSVTGSFASVLFRS